MSRPKLRILIVDDNQTDRVLVRAMVAKLRPGLVHEAENGAVAEAKIKTAAQINQSYDIVILDWNMPGTNGLKLLQVVRSQPTLKTIPVIVMTATAEREIVHAAIKNGADDFIVKPIDEQLLRQKIQTLVT